MTAALPSVVPSEFWRLGAIVQVSSQHWAGKNSDRKDKSRLSTDALSCERRRLLFLQQPSLVTGGFRRGRRTKSSGLDDLWRNITGTLRQPNKSGGSLHPLGLKDCPLHEDFMLNQQGLRWSALTAGWERAESCCALRTGFLPRSRQHRESGTEVQINLREERGKKKICWNGFSDALICGNSVLFFYSFFFKPDCLRYFQRFAEVLTPLWQLHILLHCHHKLKWILLGFYFWHSVAQDGEVEEK